MRNVRRHFRLDVELPAVIKLAENDQKVSLVVPELTSGHWQIAEVAHDQRLKSYSQSLMFENELAGRVIGDLVLRVGLLCEAITYVVQGYCVYDHIDFYKTRRGKSPMAMQLKPGSVTSDLLRSFNQKLELYFTVIDKIIQRDYRAVLLILDHEGFDFDQRLIALHEKVRQGSLLATSVAALNEKIERHLPFIERYKQEILYMTDKNSWPTRMLNLSAGGVGFVASEPYPKFARLKIDFRFMVEGYDATFNMAGNIVSSRPIRSGYYVAVEFTNATEVMQRRLIMFLQYEELRQLVEWQSHKQESHHFNDIYMDLL